MALTILQIVRQLKADVAKAIDPTAVLEVCERLKVQWRKRILDPAITVQVFLVQILHGNTACSAMPGLVDLTFSATAYCAARMRLPLKLFQGKDKVSGPNGINLRRNLFRRCGLQNVKTGGPVLTPVCQPSVYAV